VRAVVQTVSRASITVDDEVVAAIADGLLVLLGVTHDDTEQIADALARKVHGLRILDGEASASDAGAPLLVVSQFTLYGDARKGRRPTWSAAAPADVAEPLVTSFVAALRGRGATVETGLFRTHMLVESVNVGPRTVLLEMGSGGTAPAVPPWS
jgi:D-tyrosyl-tRNA(Tyr) deacylase